MFVSTAIKLCEQRGLKWESGLSQFTDQNGLQFYIKLILKTKHGDYHLPIVPPLSYGEWEVDGKNISKVDGYIVSYILTNLKY